MPGSIYAHTRQSVSLYSENTAVRLDFVRVTTNFDGLVSIVRQAE